MDHGYANWGSATFWLFIGVAVAASAWQKTRRNAEQHETLRRIIEKTGNIDEAKLKDLFTQAPSTDWLKSNPGDGYRGLRVGGTIVMCIAAGLAIFFLATGHAAAIPQQVTTIGLAASCLVAIVGAGLFFASRFAEPPPGRGNEPPAR